MKLICFCGDESEHVHGALYCRNPDCPEYLNIVRSTALLSEPTEIEVDIPPAKCTDDSMPFHDYNCTACTDLK